ncbi:MAG: hypothetical protein HND47_02095 [Chloroflexi bacterium]|nr:hypothetical protein [Chloroflexota bacterium]
MSASKTKSRKAPQGKKRAAKTKGQDGEQKLPGILSVDTVVEALVEENQSPMEFGVDDLIEPDESLLVLPEDDFEEVLTLHVRETPELAEDPVRLYLREIGQVKLLGADSEFRLATLIEAGPADRRAQQVEAAQGGLDGAIHLSCARLRHAHLVGTPDRRRRTD